LAITILQDLRARGSTGVLLLSQELAIISLSLLELSHPLEQLLLLGVLYGVQLSMLLTVL
jgi:hypothetical protein